MSQLYEIDKEINDMNVAELLSVFRREYDKSVKLAYEVFRINIDNNESQQERNEAERIFKEHQEIVARVSIKISKMLSGIS